MVHPAKDVTPLVQITPASPAVGEAHPKAVLDAAAQPSAILQPVPVQLEDHHGDALRRMGHGDHHDAECVLCLLPRDSYSSCCAVMKAFSPARWTSRQFSAVSTGIDE